MRNFLLLLYFTFYSSAALSYSFKEAVGQLSHHELFKSSLASSNSLKEQGDVVGSWGDPMLKLAAKNFPKDGLKDDQTPMTGMELSLSQKISLTTKYGHLGSGQKAMGDAKELDAQRLKTELLKRLWFNIIDKKKVLDQKKILVENLQWITKMLKVSKKLYSNGKLSQQALLDIQIRKSELEIDINNKSFELVELQEELSYLMGLKKGEIELDTVPWKVLDYSQTNKIDFKELSFQKLLKAKEHQLTAKKLAYAPDLTFSLGYTKRSNIDNKGDFVSASVSFPLPFSDKKYAEHFKASYEKSMAQSELNNYKFKKRSEVAQIESRIEKIKSELAILNQSTIKFAENSRKITFRSYSYGRSSYTDLLQSELKLQKLLFKSITLNATLLKNKAQKKYLMGDALYE